jgi:hypothetical protein
VANTISWQIRKERKDHRYYYFFNPLRLCVSPFLINFISATWDNLWHDLPAPAFVLINFTPRRQDAKKKQNAPMRNALSEYAEFTGRLFFLTYTG